jgi:hypothetical protein
VSDTTTTERRDATIEEMAPDAPPAETGDPPMATETRPHGQTQDPARPESATEVAGHHPGGGDQPGGNGESHAPLFDQAATGEYRSRWSIVQAGFVDEPRSAVKEADALVADVMKRLADTFAAERKSLETQWSRGDDVSTEELRLALRRYRSFFDRLLSI